MSLYTTPLQFGYFFSLLLWILLLVRGYQNHRLSDKLLGWIMFILAMELQDYTFGFAGINFLWDELNGFPRGVSLLFGPAIFFYFKSQINRSFTIKKEHLLHLLPYCIYFFYQIIFFIQGPEAVLAQQEMRLDLILSYVLRFALWGSYLFYISKCLIIYRNYRGWSLNQFSNTELINFSWFRNFLYTMIFWLLCREFMNILDSFLDLDFYQDWWWNLALAVVAIYIGLAGYAQKQAAKIHFETNPLQLTERNKNQLEIEKAIPIETIDKEKVLLGEKLKILMKEERLYLQPDLTLHELAQHLSCNSSQLSASINLVFKQNFNDFINSLRIEEFIRLNRTDSYKHFTLLAIALDSGFNSKATFNRAFKKLKSCSPKIFFSEK
ncbi:MAG: AraC-like DNA-binding protein [Marivirga sp.]|jgi:AraC-like DNA-binding protein